MPKARGKQVRSADGTVLEVRGKASNGSGSVFAYRGGWTATYEDPATGKRRSVRGRTRAEAEQRRSDRLAAAAKTRGDTLGKDPSVAEVAEWWLTNRAASSVRPSTLHAYGKDVARIGAVIGQTRIADLNLEAVEAFIAKLRTTHPGPDGKPSGPLRVSTIRNARARLRQIVECAMDLGYVESNPVVRVKLPMATAEERTAKRVLDPDEVHRLLGAFDGTKPYDAAAALLFTSGCRVNEALGLAWSDVDLAAGTARIRRGCAYIGGGIGCRLDRPKTVATAGVMHLSPSVVVLLKARRKQQAADRLAAGPVWQTITYEGENMEMVFTTKTGGLVARQHVSKALHDVCGRAGVDPAHVATHTGRRSVATNLFRAGGTLDDIARHVGHASPSTTAGYVQDLGDRPAETARRAWELLDPAATPN